MTTILLVEDHPVVVMVSRQLLEAAGVSTIVDARDAISGYEAYIRHRPDVVVIDLSLRDEPLGGLALIERIRSHNAEAKILVFTMHADPSIVVSAIEAGATGYLLKDAAPEELPAAVDKVLRGQHHIDQQLAVGVTLLRTKAKRRAIDDLTPRERQVLGLLAKGMSYSNIADQLKVSYKTVINLTYRLRQKLGANGLFDLIRLAVELTRANP